MAYFIVIEIYNSFLNTRINVISIICITVCLFTSVVQVIIADETIGKQESLFMTPKTHSSIYRSKITDAYQDRRTFTIFGNYSTIRRSLLKRGQQEKLPPKHFSNLQSDTPLKHRKHGNDYKSVAVSKIINHFPAFFKVSRRSVRRRMILS